MSARRSARIAGLGVVLVFLAWTGVYNVAASRGHWSIVEWFLAFGMRNSVATRALAITAPPLDDPDLVQLGAATFIAAAHFAMPRRVCRTARCPSHAPATP